MDLYAAASTYSDAWTTHTTAVTTFNAASDAFWGAQPDADMPTLAVELNAAEAAMQLAAIAVVKAQNALLESARGI